MFSLKRHDLESRNRFDAAGGRSTNGKSLVVTIDVEEDDWSDYRAEGATVENLKKIPELQNLFDELGVKPTYLITYPVATDPWGVELLSAYLSEGKCEIGMHCHPWNTPPFEEPLNKRNSMLCHLPEPLQYRKLKTLHETICSNLGVVPSSFRAGRWGFSEGVARSIRRLGYRIDTSVSPFVNWNVYGGPDFTDFKFAPYRFEPDDITEEVEDGALLQVPATVGFLQSNFQRARRLMAISEARLSKALHLKGILWRLELLNKVWLSPELSDSGEMIRLGELMGRKSSCLNMSFHSSSLLAGLTPFVSSKSEESAFLLKIRKFLEFATDAGIEPMTLTRFESVFDSQRRSMEQEVGC